METIKTYKGFDKNLQCRGFQYEVGKTYTTDKAIACETGFHACENPLHIFNYYRPADGTRYGETLQSGEISKHADDSKVASTEITIKAEIGLGDLIRAAANGDRSSAAATGKHAVAMSSGYQGKASGDEGCALFLVYRGDDGSILHAKAAIVGRDGILPRVLYTLDSDGNFVCAD